MIKNEMKFKAIASMPDKYFDVFNLDENKKDIYWEEEGKEFSFHGKMYDVARIIVRDGKTLIYCYNDAKEDNLIVDFLKKINPNNNPYGKQQLAKCHFNLSWINQHSKISVPKQVSANLVCKAFCNFDEDTRLAELYVNIQPPDLANISGKTFLQLSGKKKSDGSVVSKNRNNSFNSRFNTGNSTNPDLRLITSENVNAAFSTANKHHSFLLTSNTCVVTKSAFETMQYLYVPHIGSYYFQKQIISS